MCEGKNISLSKEYYGYIINQLQQFRFEMEKRAQVLSILLNGVVNFGCIIICSSSINFGKLSCKYFKNKVDSWMLDSRASNHMTFNKFLLTNVMTLSYSSLVVLPNGNKVKVTEIGSMTLVSMITLHEVMFVPSFSYDHIYLHS